MQTSKKYIAIFEFAIIQNINENISDKDLQKELYKLQIISTLYHELKHQYQMENNKIRFFKNGSTYNLNKLEYEKKWIKKNVKDFSNQILKNNYLTINKILGIKNKWALS